VPRSALGQKRTLHSGRVLSALPPKADMVQHDRDVRFVPKADKVRCSKQRPIMVRKSLSKFMGQQRTTSMAELGPSTSNTRLRVRYREIIALTPESRIALPHLDISTR